MSLVYPILRDPGEVSWVRRRRHDKSFLAFFLQTLKTYPGSPEGCVNPCPAYPLAYSMKIYGPFNSK